MLCHALLNGDFHWWSRWDSNPLTVVQGYVSPSSRSYLFAYALLHEYARQSLCPKWWGGITGGPIFLSLIQHRPYHIIRLLPIVPLTKSALI